MSKVLKKRDRKRAEIIVAATRLMAAADFDEVSIGDICQEAHISVGTFYHYFEKKSDLLVGLLGLVDQYLEENVAASLTREEEGENLTLLALGFARHVREKGPERSRLINGIPLSDVDLSGSPRLLNTLSRQIIERGQAKGQFRTDRSAEELTRLYLITIRGVAADWSRRSMAYDILEVMEEEMALFVRGIAP